jgi:hypothetical protein
LSIFTCPCLCYHILTLFPFPFTLQCRVCGASRRWRRARRPLRDRESRVARRRRLPTHVDNVTVVTIVVIVFIVVVVINDVIIVVAIVVGGQLVGGAVASLRRQLRARHHAGGGAARRRGAV